MYISKTTLETMHQAVEQAFSLIDKDNSQLGGCLQYLDYTLSDKLGTMITRELAD